MTPVIPQLDPLPLPAPAGLLWFLLLLTFFLHVVAMNAVLGDRSSARSRGAVR